MMNKRLLLAFSLAVGVTFGLFGLMVSLIASGEKGLDDAPQTNLAEILMPDREISENTKDNKPKKPEQNEPPPEIGRAHV